ncbi:sugar-binding protein [Pseudomonas sp. 15FMM2]|uniref:Sugar-binding protein n=1 Tax=Pseudomonas imrae TaxID=2992837 RepID=A0ACC7PD57_9PSED
MQYHRTGVTDNPQTRVNRQVFGASGFLLEQWDPRQFALGVTGVASQSGIYSLSGQVVRTESADAGWRLMLRGQAGQLLHTWDSRQAHQEQRYDGSLRPIAVFEQAAQDPQLRCVERLTYAEAVPAEAAGNRCGRLIRHADPAGVLLLDEYGVDQSVLRQTRQLRTQTSPVDWTSSNEEQDQQLDSQAYTTAWRYDALGALLEQTDAKNNRQHWCYGQSGWLTEVALTLKGGVRKVLMNQCVYDANGQVESEQSGNDVIRVAKYAAQDARLLQLTVHRKGENKKPLQDLVYAYDPVGNILEISDLAQPTQWHSNARIDAVSRYQYDTLYQLAQATGRENSLATYGQYGPGRVTFGAVDDGLWRNYTQHYSYDAGGNLVRLQHVPSSGTGYTRQMSVAAGSNRALSVGSDARALLETAFDANGNQRTLGGGQQLGWSVRNQLTHATQVRREEGDSDVENYTYDSQAQRALKITSNQVAGKPHTQQVHYLPGLQVHTSQGKRLNVLEIETGNGRVTVWQWELGRPRDVIPDQMQFSILDHLNSSSLELDEQARLLSQEHYYPYGSTAWWATGNTVQANYKIRRYSGKERDATGLYYYGLRYYAPWLQRWISPDPLGDTDGLNLYAMTLGNPIRFMDVAGAQATFGEQFQPSRGDMIFGLSEAVQGYRSFWSKLSGRGDLMAAYFSGADVERWTAELGTSARAFASFRKELPDDFRDLEAQGPNASQRTVQELKQGLRDQISASARRFYEGVASKYSGCTATFYNQQFSRRFVADLASGDYSVEKTAGQYIGEGLRKIQQKLISRSSKSSLVTLTSTQSTAVVHFVLDYLDLDRVINKSQRSATASELRWLYRHRTQLSGKVVFYKNHQRVEAPWESHTSQWARYQPKGGRAPARRARR